MPRRSSISKANGAPQRILDLGTGPGTLLLAALDVWPDATGLGIDLSRRALSYASANARRLGFEKRLKFKIGNWAEGIRESFDLILCNPPYVAEGAELGPGVREYEPDEALFAGEKGLDAYASWHRSSRACSTRAGLPRSKSGTTRPAP